ncbi:hypothetical protein AV530_004894 [Patagioenas fasciata monilis]|uniref:Uncharacterized protein n=1 Tax=Patagioenas fasciata monilis TaxID=372326 RepID=A0A1V4KCZ1_PATFA|nr:hypothetical protein AV530_004894 [Patagioenas fasciata monilis]
MSSKRSKHNSGRSLLPPNAMAIEQIQPAHDLLLSDMLIVFLLRICKVGTKRPRLYAGHCHRTAVHTGSWPAAGTALSLGPGNATQVLKLRYLCFHVTCGMDYNMFN